MLLIQFRFWLMRQISPRQSSALECCCNWLISHHLEIGDHRCHWGVSWFHLKLYLVHMWILMCLVSTKHITAQVKIISHSNLNSSCMFFCSCVPVCRWTQFASTSTEMFWYTKTVPWTVWYAVPDSKIHGVTMGPTWVLSAPVGPHVGPMNLAIRGI